MTKKTIAVMFGGKSPEHKISLLSSVNIVKNIDKEKYDLILIGVSKEGRMFLYGNDYLNNRNDADKIELKKSNKEVVFVSNQNPEKRLYNLATQKYLRVDLVFPILHGENGEDGSLQGMMEFNGISYVSSNILSSALTMDKDLTKRVLNQAGIKNAKYLVFNKWEEKLIKFSKVKDELGLPLFVKPARCGSSVGVSKVKDETEFIKAVRQAFYFDEKILIEETMVGREIECSVLGKKKIISAKVLGEVIVNNKKGFYSYEAKYIDEDGAWLKIPAELTNQQTKIIRNICEKAYKSLGLDVYARIDGFLLGNGEFYINEINSIPGFTNISMFPKLFEADSWDQKQLINKLIDLAQERRG